MLKSIESVLQDHGASNWLKNTLFLALQRDPAYAVRDAKQLLELLEENLAHVSGEARLPSGIAVEGAANDNSLVTSKIGIGAASITDRSPATPPGMRVRTGRFE